MTWGSTLPTTGRGSGAQLRHGPPPDLCHPGGGDEECGPEARRGVDEPMAGEAHPRGVRQANLRAEIGQESNSRLAQRRKTPS